MKTPRGGTRPRVGSFFELAEAVGLFYGTKGTAAAIKEFRDVAQAYRGVAKAQGQGAWLTYVIRLLFTCPLLLQRPPGLEWVTDDLQWALRHRQLRPDVDRDFWKAVTTVRGMMVTRGRPRDKAWEFFRYEWMVNLMYPVTTHPEFGLVRTKKRVNKTTAVTELADLEERWSGRRPAERQIWRSVQRVEAYVERLQAQLKIARTNLAVRTRKRNK